ncbi:hypothetical protein CkaCkLH20_00134 [Colletotrichum karsti]|uniref:Calcofluor white hypersensitive protein n=1 Tax=Colletotrichum karsti TaxID=1095194 RepID=A0A9P6IEN5_9PEZI|nr:uncharacterized protein CkaCkLH20_00134 [Colletotrichum karsti]KAF9882098.1 hypothetical protein CkaCkLH20_00134 [Colletotrichum karsti]
MSKSKAPLFLGLTAAGGVGYYLYSAGGNPNAAEKKFESDVHKASAEIKSHIPGRTPDAQKGLGDTGARTGAKVDSAIAEADKQFAAAKSNAEAYAKDAKAEALKKIDQFDKKVEDGTAKAKSGISSWFGGK